MTDQELKDAVGILIKKEAEPALIPVGRYIGVILTVVTLGAGIIGSWYTASANIGTNQKSIGRLEAVVEDLEDQLQEVKLNAVKESSDISTLKEDIREIKQDVKSLLNQP